MYRENINHPFWRRELLWKGCHGHYVVSYVSPVSLRVKQINGLFRLSLNRLSWCVPWFLAYINLKGNRLFVRMQFFCLWNRRHDHLQGQVSIIVQLLISSKRGHTTLPYPPIQGQYKFSILDVEVTFLLNFLLNNSRKQYCTVYRK